MQQYTEDLSYIHFKGFETFIRNASIGLQNIMRQNGIASGHVIDLGSGSGFWAKELIKNGFHVIGVDISSPMVKIAKKRVPDAVFYNASFLNFMFPLAPKIEVVTALGEVFNYLFDENHNLDSLQKMFKRIYISLKPGGILLFDILNEALLDHDASYFEQKAVEGDDWKVYVSKEIDIKTNKLYRHITSLRIHDGKLIKVNEVHAVQLYNQYEILKILENIGFEVSVLNGYGLEKFEYGHVGYLAKKM